MKVYYTIKFVVLVLKYYLLGLELLHAKSFMYETLVFEIDKQRYSQTDYLLT